MLARRTGVACTACHRPLIPAYPGQTLHPDPCDPAPPGWTAAQLAEWGEIVDSRRAHERAHELPDGPGAMPRPGPSGHHRVPGGGRR